MGVKIANLEKCAVGKAGAVTCGCWRREVGEQGSGVGRG